MCDHHGEWTNVVELTPVSGNLPTDYQFIIRIVENHHLPDKISPLTCLPIGVVTQFPFCYRLWTKVHAFASCIGSRCYVSYPFYTCDNCNTLVHIVLFQRLKMCFYYWIFQRICWGCAGQLDGCSQQALLLAQLQQHKMYTAIKRGQMKTASDLSGITTLPEQSAVPDIPVVLRAYSSKWIQQSFKCPCFVVKNKIINLSFCNYTYGTVDWAKGEKIMSSCWCSLQLIYTYLVLCTWWPQRPTIESTEASVCIRWTVNVGSFILT